MRTTALIEAKLEFFAVAKPLQEFLSKFQTKAPMTPFLPLSLKDLLLAIMGRFSKKEVLEKTDAFKKLSTIDPADKKNQKTQSMLTLSLLFKVLQKNLQEKTLVASRFVYSSVKSDANHFNELSFTHRLKGNV